MSGYYERAPIAHSEYVKRVINRWPVGYVSMQGLESRAGLTRAAIAWLVRTGDLPKPERVTPNKNGWPAAVIDAWMAKREAQ